MTQDSILVTTDAVGLYRSITHNADLEALKDVPDCRQNKKIPIDMLVQMAKFVLTLTTLSFGKKYCVKKPRYTCIFMDKFQTDFLKTHKLQPFVWLGT